MNKYQQALNNCVNRWAPTADWNLLKALVEKATPEKPKNWKAERRPNGRVEFNCPVCNRLYTERVNFCSSCGQAIDWGKR